MEIFYIYFAGLSIHIWYFFTADRVDGRYAGGWHILRTDEAVNIARDIYDNIHNKKNGKACAFPDIIK